MRFRFKRKELGDLYHEGKGRKSYPQEIVKAFSKIMGRMESAPDERDLRALKSLHYEKLREKKWEGCFSVRLNNQYRLIFDWQHDEEGKYMNIIEINKDHYK